MNSKLKKSVSILILFLFLFNSIIIDGFKSTNVFASDQIFNININFQPEDTAVPEGYIADNGDVYAFRNGYSYGWSIPHKDGVFKRNVNSDPLLDTVCEIKPNGLWEIAVPNGEYDVTLSVGDSVYAVNITNNSLMVENIAYLSNINLQVNEFKNITEKVTVSDGRLSIYQEGIEKSKIPLNYIQIHSADQTPIPPLDTSNKRITLEMYNQSTKQYEKQIDPHFKLTNNTNETIDMTRVKIRYYYMVGGDTPQNFWCDWSSVGTGAVKGQFVKMPTPMVGADYYVEMTFDENVKDLEKGKSEEIKTRFSRDDWNEYCQTDDYSFNVGEKNKFIVWQKATVYIDDQLVWGEEPSQPLQITTSAKVQMYNKHRNDNWNTIHTYFKLFNTGNVQFNLSDVKIRYYYTKEGNQTENFWCDWSSVGGSNITSNFVKLPAEFSNEKVTNYIDYGFAGGTGNLIAGDSLEIQARVAKSDWSDYNQTNDYSFNPDDNHYVDWNKVSVYIKGKLVWGNGVISDTPSKIVSQATESTISLSWENIYAAISYEVEADGVIKNVGFNTSFIDTNLQPGTEHKYRVRAVSDVNAGDWSTVVVKWTLPGITQHISAISTSSSIIVSWEPIIGATSYEIEVSGMPVDVGMNTSYIHEGLNPNTQRAYRVRGKNSSGSGKWSETISKSTLPGSSFGISTSATARSITLVWDRAAGATGYDLEIDGAVVNDITETQYTHESLLPSTEHTYRVRPKNQDGTGNWTDLVTTRTLPETPTGLSAAVKEDSITLTWNEAEGAQAYEVEVDGTVSDSVYQTSYVYEGLQNNSEHFFRVRAINNEAASFWSNTVSTATLPAVPANLKVNVVGSNIEVSWDMVEGAANYDIEINGTPVSGVIKNKYILEGAAVNTKYIFRVRSVGSSGASEWSTPIESISLIGIPQGFTATPANDSISLEWQSVEGATGYELLADGNTISVSNDTYYIHRGLEPNSIHVYRIRALNESIAGQWSEPLIKTTIQGVPGNLRGKLIFNSILVMWEDVSGATSYEIRADGNIIDTEGDNSFIHKGLANNSKHTYSVRSKKDGVVSPWSREITIETAPDVPQNLKATATTNSIKLSWDSVSGAVSYDIEIDGRVHLEVTNTAEYSYEGLEANTRHYFRVRARNSESASEWSEVLQKNTDPELQIKAEKDNIFNFVFIIPANYTADSRTITVEYNTEELEVVDLCAVTPSYETSTGKIQGTDITVESFTPGRIVYSVSDTTKTEVNSIKFIAKISVYTKVVYEVK